MLIAWVLIYVCIRNGASSVGKVVKYTVFLPVICLVIMAIKGFTMPNAFEGLKAFFLPQFSALADPDLWIAAMGQVFFSLSIMMAIMFAYGSFLDRKSNIVTDAIIIAFADLAISVLSGAVLFTTMYGTGMTTDDMSMSGIGTAFMIYPKAIVNISTSGVLNSVFAFIFYFCLCTLAIDSAFSIIEGVSTTIADKFHLDKKKTTRTVCIVSGVLSLFFVTGAGLAWLDIVDNWANNFNIILIGVFEALAVGWCFKTTKVLDEINKNTKKVKMPSWWFNTTIKFIAPIVLIGLFTWTVVNLFMSGGIYGAADGYSLASNIIGGWVLMALIFSSGFIVRAIVSAKKKKGFIETDISWDDIKDTDETK